MPEPGQVRRTIVDLVDRRALGATLRSRPMRRYLAFRLILGLSTLADPFIIVFGLSEMGLQPRYVGGSILVFALAQVGGGVVWPLLLDTRGSRLPLQFAALLRLTAVTLAVMVPGVARSSAYLERYDSPAVASWAFVATFALLGLARSAHDPSEHRYLEDITTSPTLQRAAIVATNVILTLTAGAALIGAFVALIASGLLFEGRPRVQYRSGARSGRIRRISRVRRRFSTRAQ
jgi:MFS family permease